VIIENRRPASIFGIHEAEIVEEVAGELIKMRP